MNGADREAERIREEGVHTHVGGFEPPKPGDPLRPDDLETLAAAHH